MISQQKLIKTIKAAIFHDMEDRTFEEMQTYKVDECTIWEAAYDSLEGQGLPESYLESDGFYGRFRANFDEIIESDWYYDLKSQNTRDAYDAKQEYEHPYAYRGLTRGDFYA